MCSTGVRFFVALKTTVYLSFASGANIVFQGNKTNFTNYNKLLYGRTPKKNVKDGFNIS